MGLLRACRLRLCASACGHCLRPNRKELETAADKTRSELSSFKSSNAQLRKDLESALQSAAAGRKVVEAATAAKEAAQGAAEACRKDKDAAVAKTKEGEGVRMELQKEKELAEHRLQATRQEVEASKKALKKEHDAVRSTAAARDDALAKCARLEREVAGMTEQKMNVDGANVKLRGNLREAEAALAKAKQECKRLGEMLSQEEQDVVALNVQVCVSLASRSTRTLA